MPLTDAEVVDETQGTNDFNPSVVSLGEDGFVIVWRDASASGNEIVGRRFNVDGSPASSRQVLSSIELSSNDFPEIVALDDGGFVVVWSADGADNNDSGIVGARFDADLNQTSDCLLYTSPSPRDRG